MRYGRYTKVSQRTENAIHAENFMRSMYAPLARATVIAANVNWKTTKINSGIVPEMLLTVMVFIMNLSRLPIMPYVGPEA